MPNWKKITQIEEFEELLNSVQPSVIFKHSTRCPVSSMMKMRFESQYDSKKDLPDTVYLIDVIANRDVSNYLAQSLAVQHESPQLIVIKEGVAIYDASHAYISADELSKIM